MVNSESVVNLMPQPDSTTDIRQKNFVRLMYCLSVDVNEGRNTGVWKLATG